MPFVLFILALCLSCPPASAQQRTPHIGYVYPAGGQRGTSFQITVGGQFLDNVSDARISGSAARATILEHNKPLTNQQASLLRDKLKELLQKKSAATQNRAPATSQPATKPAWTAEDEKTVAEIRKQLASFQKKPSSPAIAETVTLQITLPSGTEPGERELRLKTPSGWSNPLVFCVGQLPEFREDTATESQTTITLPNIINGQIMPGEVDRFRFTARQGQRLVVNVSARRLIPYLADAVPGWFQATLALYDAKGNEVAYVDDFRFNPDPVLCYQIPQDGQYTLEIKDSIYRGREDFVYRIALGKLPFVTSIFPLGGRIGGLTRVDVQGWNLPAATITQNAKGKSPGIYPLSVRQGEYLSNQVPFALDALPESLDREPNDQAGSAPLLVLPVVINGRIDQPGDWDIVRFEGHAGEKIVAEVYARRLGSPLDSVLKLTDATGRQITFNDDHEDKSTGLNTHHADSYLTATLPETGTYCLHLGDTQRKGGKDYAYRLRISPPRPDYELRLVPSTLSIRSGSSAALTVYALRKDGFSGEIALSLKNAPPGFSLKGARIPANQDQVRITLTTPSTPLKEPLSLSLEGTARVAGNEITRPAVPAEDMMQAFAYHHLVPAKEWLVDVSRRGMPRIAGKILSPTPIKIPAGGTARVRIGSPAQAFKGAARLELSEPPAGISIQSISSHRQETEIVLQCDAAKAKPGLKGNLIVEVFADRSPTTAGASTQSNRRRTPLGTLPAIRFEIVGP